MTAPYILAKTMREAHTFAREELALDRGHYRVVTSPSSISGPRGADLHLVPGWERRHDKFAMRGALKYTRLNVVRPEDREAEAPHTVPDGLDPAGEQITIEEVNAFLLAVGSPDQQIKELVAKPTETEQAEAPVVRRRRRCKNCRTLHFKDETCPSEPLPGV